VQECRELSRHRAPIRVYGTENPGADIRREWISPEWAVVLAFDVTYNLRTVEPRLLPARTKMKPIRFRFDPEKMVAALTYLAERVSDLDAMKSVKLLFFADKAHLLAYGRPIIGDAYYGLEHGPVPTATYSLIKQVLSSAVEKEAEQIARLIDEYLFVDRQAQYPQFKAKKQPDMDLLSSSDVDALNATLEKYGNKTAIELSELAHQQPEVRYADERRAELHAGSVPIPFHLFFDPQKDKAILSAVESRQEDRDFAESARW